MAAGHLPLRAPRGALTITHRGCPRGFACAGPLGAWTTIHQVAGVASCSLHRSNSHRQYGNVDPSSIDYALRPRLRHRLTPGGRTCPGKPWNSGGGDSHPTFRYSCPHSHFRTVHARFPLRFDPCGTLLYHPLAGIRGFGIRFTPDHFRRGISRLVSYYALFK